LALAEESRGEVVAYGVSKRSRVMTRKTGSVLALIVNVTIMTSICAAQGQGTGAKVGETVDNAFQSIKKGARNAGDAMRGQYGKARSAVQNMNVSSRIYGRLHWEKALQGSKIEIEVQTDGVAVLTGIVSDTKARNKAVELTQDTVGVSQVVDNLTLVTPTTPPTPPSPTNRSPREKP
jgi:osmotically-inducible protein OsmY